MPGASISRWTMSYFAAALMALMSAGGLMVAGFGYPSVPIDAPETLVVVHILAIGWLGLLFCGALLQFVPVLVARPLRAAWVAAPALLFIILGLGCLLAGFLAMAGDVDISLLVLPWGACFLSLGLGALIIAFSLTLWSARPLSVPAMLVATALGALVVTAALGSIFSAVLSGVDIPQHLAALVPTGIPFHAAFGLLGWMSLTAFGVSYRLFTMFMLAPEGGRTTGRPVLWFSAAALAALALSLCATVDDFTPLTSMAAIALGLMLIAVALYCRDVLHLYRARRRKRLELNTRASLVALGSLLVALTVMVAASLMADPHRLVAVSVYLLVFGWLSGLGLGQLYKIVPFLTWLECYGPVMGKTKVPRVQDLVNEKRAVFWFWLHFLSVAAGAVFLGLSDNAAFRVASACQALAVIGLVFEYVQARRLSCAPSALRLPAGASRPPLIIPIFPSHHHSRS